VLGRIPEQQQSCDQGYSAKSCIREELFIKFKMWYIAKS